jgi:hypothetical protein
VTFLREHLTHVAARFCALAGDAATADFEREDSGTSFTESVVRLKLRLNAVGNERRRIRAILDVPDNFTAIEDAQTVAQRLYDRMTSEAMYEVRETGRVPQIEYA